MINSLFYLNYQVSFGYIEINLHKYRYSFSHNPRKIWLIIKKVHVVFFYFLPFFIIRKHFGKSLNFKKIKIRHLFKKKRNTAIIFSSYHSRFLNKFKSPRFIKSQRKKYKVSEKKSFV